MIGTYTIEQGDVLAVLRTMPSDHFHCVVTSPPYWGLRDYQVDGQIGLEPTPEAFIERMVEVFREVRRVLRPDGTCWVNMGDSYASGSKDRTEAQASKKTGLQGGMSSQFSCLKQQSKIAPGLKPKDLVGMPWRLALALQADGWYLRQDIIWHKPNPMPESVTDRCTKAHEYIFLLTKRAHYYYDAEAIKAAIVRGDAGSNYHTGKTATHQLNRASTKPRKTKVPGGWDTNAGGHGTIHRNGRTSAQYVEATPPPGRNARSVWTMSTQAYAEAHFATFPEELPRRCILAGTSERGCCPQCGTPWRRIVAVDYENPGNRTTNGWQPGCDCIDDEATGESTGPDIAPAPVPCRVLDPFAGSGTTLGVACLLGRDAVGVELNPDYITMALDRVGRMVKPSTYVSQAAVDAPLFTPAD